MGAQLKEEARFKQANGKIHEAMKLLKEASGESAMSTRNGLIRRYEDSVDVLSKKADKLKNNMRDQALQVDKRAHESPWAFIGVASVIAVIVGFLFGKRR